VIDFNMDSRSTTNTGQAVCAIDPAAFDDIDVLRDRLDKLVAEIRRSAKLPTTDRIWLPGEQSHYKRLEYAAKGIPLSGGVVEELDRIAQDRGILPLPSLLGQ